MCLRGRRPRGRGSGRTLNTEHPTLNIESQALDTLKREQRTLSLRLWLPGYHTPSLNVTKGGHWKQYYGLKQEAAKVLLGVLKETPGIPAKALLVVDGIAQGGQGKSRGGNRALLKAFGVKAESNDRGRVRVGGRGRAGKTVLKYTRVTCQPLDTENLCGSTKALTDCLVKAFPQWLPDDAPEFVEILHAQVRCGSKCEQGTWVELEAPDFGKGMKEQGND